MGMTRKEKLLKFIKESDDVKAISEALKNEDYEDKDIMEQCALKNPKFLLEIRGNLTQDSTFMKELITTLLTDKTIKLDNIIKNDEYRHSLVEELGSINVLIINTKTTLCALARLNIDNKNKGTISSEYIDFTKNIIGRINGIIELSNYVEDLRNKYLNSIKDYDAMVTGGTSSL